ncbi:MAG: hypothetical protein GTO40_20060 [Deltaproteobacteria bacterium]|nr:hypothetical protein [Deltaproteobacteria bacterium]
MAGARYIILGENHDNADHHRLQADMLRRLVKAGRRPAVGFEMLDLDDEPTIAQHLAMAPRDAKGLGDALNWGKRGWPDWRYYQPIAQIALNAGLPIFAANLRRSTTRILRRQGIEGLPSELVHELGLDRPLPPDLRKRMANDIRQAHCGYALKDYLENMIAIQRARDTRMAERMIETGRGDGSVLVAGAGHGRTDYGVPAHLRAMGGDRSIFSLAFMEVQDGQSSPKEFAAGYEGGHLPFDYIWFTPRRNSQNPCDEFKNQLERLRETDQKSRKEDRP